MNIFEHIRNTFLSTFLKVFLSIQSCNHTILVSLVESSVGDDENRGQGICFIIIAPYWGWYTKYICKISFSGEKEFKRNIKSNIYKSFNWVLLLPSFATSSKISIKNFDISLKPISFQCDILEISLLHLPYYVLLITLTSIHITYLVLNDW